MNVQLLALRIAVLQALTDRIKAANTAARDDLLAAMAETGAERVSAKLPDGTRVASVTSVGGAGKAKARIVDEAAFLAYVKQHRPGEVIEIVRDSYRRTLLTEAEQHGELIPGVELRDANGAYLSCRPTKGGKDAIAAAWQSGALSLPEVLALPAAAQEGDPS